jgi:16S rRNA (cytosine1402-N4)-methyltransferase
MEVPYHIPVLKAPSVDALVHDPDGIYVDLTFGGGGHSRALLERLSPIGRLFAFDQDPDVLGHLPEDSRFTFIASNFRYFTNFLAYHKVLPVSGIFADLGVSSHQFDSSVRGFSLRFNEPLDMRMNPNGGGKTACNILSEYSEDALSDLLRNYGELSFSGRLAKRIVSIRAEKPVQTPEDLRQLLVGLCPPAKQAKSLVLVLQALRIEVNDELGALRSMLEQSVSALASGGRLVVISYHSLEDRMVKRFMRSGNFDGKEEKDFFGKSLSPLRPEPRSAIMPGEDEIQTNPRSRSARLRVAIKS